MSERNYLSYVIAVFRLSGYLPSNPTCYSNILKYVLVPVMSALIALVIYNLRYKHTNIFEIARIFESLSTHGHIFGRKVAILLHSRLLEELINDRRYFLKYDLCGTSLGDAFRRKMSLRNFIIKSLSAISVVMILYFFLTPVFNRNVSLPQESYIPGSGDVSRRIMFALQVVCILESLTVGVIIDGTFLLMCAELEIQFVLLKRILRSIRIEINSSDEHQLLCLNKLNMCAGYHCLLIAEHKKMRRAFSEFFLLQYLLSIEGLCIELFVINKAKYWGQLALAAIYIVGIIMQSSFTFISASNLEIEAENLSDDIFGIDWYNARNRNIPKHILFMLMKAQTALQLSGAGMLNVNRTMLLQIIRTGFSISALIRQV